MIQNLRAGVSFGNNLRQLKIMSSPVDQIKGFYEDFAHAELVRLGHLYTPDVKFSDPIHQIVGLDTLHHYFERSREGLLECRFAFDQTIEQNTHVALTWIMHYAHSKIRGGKLLQLDGVSILQLEGSKVAQQQDYYDLGKMLYEHIPLLGWGVKSVKQRI